MIEPLTAKLDGEVSVREAREEDVHPIRDIFTEVYGGDYPYPNFFDAAWLKRSVFSDGILMLVAEDMRTSDLLGTASVIFDVGAHTDLIGEFGRLAVRPDARGRGTGGLLMEARVEAIANRLHVGIVENRSVHSYSQRISEAHGFSAVGFLPLKGRFRDRESFSLFAKHFGNCLSLRRNHPRVVPEAHCLADLAMGHCGLRRDAIVDEDSAPYPQGGDFELEELTAQGLPTLMRIERGRVKNREVFGPMRLQYGFFKLAARQGTYLLAREPHRGGRGPVVGAVGYTRDELEQSVRVFELITREDEAIYFLLHHLIEHCRTWDVAYIEIDVSAHAPRMQRTLLELGFLPAAYVPAMVFHEVERLDVVKMARLLVEPGVGELQIVPSMEPIADVVLRGFRRQVVLPDLARTVHRLDLFRGLNVEQVARTAASCVVRHFAGGERLFSHDEPADALFIVIDGRVAVHMGAAPCLGHVGPGESVGELSLVSGEDHSADAVADGPVLAAMLTRSDLTHLVRQRPDIGVVLYRNLAQGLGKKLRRLDESVIRGL